ncbi:MAG: hypothetical protein J6U23_02280 [Clostridiales bacterium]|nr:hypothetical protein [Clostridiales bacterium]
MLGKYIKINNELMPNPIKFEFSLNPQENIFYSEAGTELSNIVRLDRPSFSATFNCSDRLKDKLLGLCKTASVKVKIDNGAEMSGRLRLGGSINLVENSENVGGTQGLWEVPVTFEGE